MKTEDIDRLKEICEKEGFELKRWDHEGGLFNITKKDIWQDVEFVELVTAFIGLDLKEGMVGKVISNDGNRIEVGLVNGDICYSNLNEFKPSTEQAYFEQLKKEAFERFGQIKKGDRVHRDWLDWKYGIIGEHKGSGFQYKKGPDLLLFEGSIIYESGKWATKLQERVEITEYSLTGEALWNVFKFRVKNSHKVFKGGEEIKQFLVDQLEKYLNDEKN